MYIPSSFKEERKEVLFELIRKNSFGILTSNSSNGLVATHLPFIVDPDRGKYGTLIAHFARANPHWKNIDNTSNSLVIFQGPHCYITPSWYQEEVAVPTWNYASVHVYGKLKFIHELEELRLMLEKLVKKYENKREQPWDISASEPMIETWMKAIVGFEIEIEKIEGKFKFNQNHSEGNQAGVVEGLKISNDPMEQQVACIMAKNLDQII